MLSLTYQAYQYHVEVNRVKDTRIAFLLKAVESRDQVILEIKDERENKARTAFGETARPLSLFHSSNSENNVKQKNGAAVSRDQETRNPNQMTEISNQLIEMTETLEKKNILLRNISRFTPFSKINLTEENLDAYFERIIEITEGSVYQSEYLMDADKYGKVVFDKSETVPQDSTSVFEAENRRLYAHFDLPNYPYDQVLVKWYREGETRPTELNYFKINQFGNENYTWVEPRSDWQSGRYFVEVFSASETPELLSAGSYMIEN